VIRSRHWSAAVALAGGLALWGPRTGRPALAAWLPRLMAQAWAPVVAGAGIAGGIVGVVRGRPADALVALAGAVGAISYSLRAGGRSGTLPPVIAAPPRASVRRDIPLGAASGVTSVMADLWLPAGPTDASGIGVVYLHGGLWQALDKGFLTDGLMREVAARGHAVLDVAYPLAPEADLEAMEASVLAGVRWLADHGPELGVRSDRIILAGHAGGGHLALVTAMRLAHPGRVATNLPSVRAVVAISPVTDPVAFWAEYGRVNPRQPRSADSVPASLRPRRRDHTWLDRLLTRHRIFPAVRYGNLPGGALLVHDLFGGTPSERPDRYRDWSPLHLAGAACPPVLQVTGADDAVIAPSQGRVLHAALLELGVASELVEIPRAVHGFDQYPGVSRRVAPAARRTTAAVLAFIDTHR
jgi:acetyl esterase/lipase